MEEVKTRIVTDGKFFKVQHLKKSGFPKFFRKIFDLDTHYWEDLEGVSMDKSTRMIGYSPIIFSYISEAVEARREFLERKNPKQWRVVDER